MGAIEVINMNEYRPFTTFWMDFDIADKFGIDAIKDTYKRAFSEWKHDYQYLTELVMVLNHKCWQHYERNDAYSELYADLFYEADNYALDHLKGNELKYFLEITD